MHVFCEGGGVVQHARLLRGRGSCGADTYEIQESLSAFSGDVQEQRPSDECRLWSVKWDVREQRPSDECRIWSIKWDVREQRPYGFLRHTEQPPNKNTPDALQASGV